MNVRAPRSPADLLAPRRPPAFAEVAETGAAPVRPQEAGQNSWAT